MKAFNFLRTQLALLLCLSVTAVSAQQITVTGKVTDGQNQPVAGVSVSVKNKTAHTVTGNEGKYSIPASKGDMLVFSYLGLVQEHKVKSGTLDVVLKVKETLNDISVMGFGQQANKVSNVGAVMMTESRAMLAPAFDMYYPGGEEYGSFRENRFFMADKDPLSTFSLETDGASYSNVRRMLNRGAKPDKDAIRVEEFINYFSYDYEKPKGDDPLKIGYEIGACPWNKQHRLVRIGVKAKEIPSEKLPPANFVFLIDVSGSMYGRLSLVKSSLKLLVNNLREEDKVAIVAYAGAAGEVLPATPGSDKQKIREAIDNLTAGGSTAGGSGIKLAYKIANKNFVKNGNNRIILCTDGDFNVGVSSAEGLERLVEQERKSGVFLTVLGYGMGNYKDEKMQVLAEKGNGNYAYIDNMQEANKVLVSEFGGTIYTVAKDVKIQVEFNPAKVRAYRLVGYESRLLEHKDFNDDTKDAGEIGAGHSVTVLYEVVPVGVDSNVAGSVDPLKYQVSEDKTPRQRNSNYFPDMMTIKMRFKAPDGDVSRKVEVAVIDGGLNKVSEDFRFASAVAMFAQLLKDSDFKGDATYDMVIEEARKGLSKDENGYRREFIRLVESAKAITE